MDSNLQIEHNTDTGIYVTTNSNMFFQVGASTKPVLALVNDFTISNKPIIAPSLHLGSNTDATRLISALDDSMVASDMRYITLGREASLNNQAELSFVYTGFKSDQNRLEFGRFGGALMCLRFDGRLGIGTTNPSASLHVDTSNNVTFGTGSTVYRLRTDNGITESAPGPITYAVSAVFKDYISCSAMAMTSDRRLKQNIQVAPLDRIKRLYDVDVCLYEWKDKAGHQEVGLIAQDLVSAHLTDLVSVFHRDDMKEGDDPSLEPEKQQLNVDYSRISAYNMAMIKAMKRRLDAQQSEISELKSLVDKLTSRPVVQKWLAKN